MPSRSASVAELKDGLSTFLRKVENGEEVVITNRGRAMAKIIPMPIPDGLTEHERRLVTEGKMTLAKQPFNPAIFKRKRLKASKTSVLQTLLDERAESL